MKSLWLSFCEGFLGAFQLAGSIVMAVMDTASTFVNRDLDRPARMKSDAGGH
jgi:hypothetical protein